MRPTASKAWFEAVAGIGYCVLCLDRCGPFQVAHRDYGKGMGLKTRPSETACLCFRCHQELTDGTKYDRDTKRALMDRAIVNTHMLLARAGKLRIA